MRILRIATAVLLLVTTSAFASVFTENFTGTTGNSVPGWTKFPNGAETWACDNTNIYLKYAAGGVAELTIPGNNNCDYGFSMDAAGTHSQVEILAKYKWKSGGTALAPMGPVVAMRADIEGFYGACSQWIGIATFFSNPAKDTLFLFGNDGSESEDVGCLGLQTYHSPQFMGTGFNAFDTWYIMRLRYASNMAYLKAWKAVDAEPTSWSASGATNLISFSAASGVGIDGNPSGTSNVLVFDWVIITTAGETAVNPETPTTHRRVFTTVD